MQITFEVNDLKRFINGLNNAILAYHDDTCAKMLDCPSSIKLESIPVEECNKRLDELKFVYEQLIRKEKELC